MLAVWVNVWANGSGRSYNRTLSAAALQRQVRNKEGHIGAKMSAPSQKRPFERLIGLYNHAFFAFQLYGRIRKEKKTTTTPRPPPPPPRSRTVGTEHSIGCLGLFEGSRETVKHEAEAAVSRLDSFLDDLDHNLVRDEATSVHDCLKFIAYGSDGALVVYTN